MKTCSRHCCARRAASPRPRSAEELLADGTMTDMGELSHPAIYAGVMYLVKGNRTFMPTGGAVRTFALMPR